MVALVAVFLWKTQIRNIHSRIRVKAKSILIFCSNFFSINIVFILFRIRFHLGGFAVHVFNVLLGYMIMLAIMTYNVYILIAVIIGESLSVSLSLSLSQIRSMEYLVRTLFPTKSSTKT